MESFGSNSGYIDDLHARYLADPDSVSEAWQEFFADYAPPGGRPDVPAPGAARARAAEPVATARAPGVTAVAEAPDAVVVTAEQSGHGPTAPGVTAEVLRGSAARLVDNMETSLTVPTATSVRTLAAKLLDENRRIINQHLRATSQLKVSYTHIIAFAIVEALGRHGSLNDGFEIIDDQPHRLQRPGINLGIAIDIEKRGKRMLMVPNVKDAGALDFVQFLTAYNDLVERARRGKLGVDDFADTTVTITNPGMIGTVLSVPRLMQGQGTILGIGSIGYPAEFAGMSAEALHRLGISQVMTLTSTYDHRVIQGAESGAFLATIERLLIGGDGFYRRVFEDLGVPHDPFEWTGDSLPVVLRDAGSSEAITQQARVLKLINAYRVRGHLIADLNPLGYQPVRHEELSLAYYGLTVWDLDREFITDDLAGETGIKTLRAILDILRRSYCGHFGCEFMHIADMDVKHWLKEQLESVHDTDALESTEQLHVFERLNAAEAFERFVHTSYVGHKRFSLEGCETLIAVLDALLNEAGNAGVEEVTIGMAHRGRLNVLVNIIGKSLSQVFQEFEDMDPESTDGSGDVKYHLGAHGTHVTPDGHSIRLELASNPSHLESVDPVVEGITRARQQQRSDDERKRCMAVLIHGDAAFAGQGVVIETLNMAGLRGYTTGGSVHIIVNNQIGFTTAARDARSTHYCTDIARGASVPILHVNADHPQAAVRAIALAFRFRQRFKRDVIVDLVCYRRWGHNEGDEPAYTQPLMYQLIRSKRSVRKLYVEQLLRQGDIDISTAEQMLDDFRARLESALDEVRKLKQGAPDAQALPDREASEGAARPHFETGVERGRLEEVLQGLLRVPDGFEPHRKLQSSVLDARRRGFDGDRIDWALGESLAFGTLVLEGTHVRLSGQDSGRGTFSQRHAWIYDHRTGEGHCPLAHLSPEQATFHVYDSLLSEFAVLGFEYGYSVRYPGSLVLWEAQFGDFANGAQTIIDQYLSSAEEKWRQTCSLVLLLPHGYEGQGPEHSSARLERFLQLCAEGNMRVAYPTTPAQYFHLLRRQVHTPERKPLVVMTPKSLLRLPAATSAVEAFTRGSFEEILVDGGGPEGDPAGGSHGNRWRRLVLTSGKVYYDLKALMTERGVEDLAVVRLEQYYPLPSAQLAELFQRHSTVHDVVWLQEEPRNMGAWDFLDERLAEVLADGQQLRYVGRPWSASPATGSLGRHRAEQRLLLETALE